MRQQVIDTSIHNLFRLIAQYAKGPGKIYLTGGATAVLFGWRQTTADIDIKLMPEPKGVFEAIRHVKELLHINIELASPDDFLPPLPGWQDRSIFIEEQNKVEFYHYDLYAQALSKIARGHARDLIDVQAMLKRKLIDKPELKRLFHLIEPELFRYPAINIAALCSKVEAALG